MSGKTGLAGIWLDELSLGENSHPEIVLSVFARAADFRRLASDDRLPVRVQAVLERQWDRTRLRLIWELGEERHEHFVDLSDPRQRELLQRLGQQPLLPLVICGLTGQFLEVYDCENLFHAEQPPLPQPARERRKRECRHSWAGRHSA